MLGSFCSYKFSKEPTKLEPKLLSLSSDNFIPSDENVNIENCQEMVSTKPVSKFRLSDSFLMPISKSPPKIKIVPYVKKSCYDLGSCMTFKITSPSKYSKGGATTITRLR